MGPQILKKFYSCTIEGILTGCITAWYGNCLASDRKALQRVVRTAQYITGAKLPAIQDLYTRRCQRKALKIVKDSSHPSHRLFSLLPHGKRYRSAKSRFGASTGTTVTPDVLACKGLNWEVAGAGCCGGVSNSPHSGAFRGTSQRQNAERQLEYEEFCLERLLTAHN
ncbi:hypothetical protein J4Q44_G00075310 [Coregonus suidteri]|uniref:Uncharacterized protein n=1 Tax=Coregonus suidteri TaxID=861788 RepID=A0AAN8M4X3_9TELE